MKSTNEIRPPYGQEGYTGPLRPVDPLMVENGDVTSLCNESYGFKKFSIRTNCKTCNRRVTTNVDKKLRTQGWAWVICSCLAFVGGVSFLGLLVLCVDTFWKFNHYCPRCSNKLATYSPKPSCRITTLIIVTGFAVIAFDVFIGLYLFHTISSDLDKIKI